jgi:hypothetical protein
LTVVKRTSAERGSWTSKAGNVLTALGRDHIDLMRAKCGVGAPGWSAGAIANKRKADECAARLRAVIVKLRAEAVTSLKGITRALNEHQVPAPIGGRWQATSLLNLLAREAAQDTTAYIQPRFAKRKAKCMSSTSARTKTRRSH